jgi:hypothetical protein
MFPPSFAERPEREWSRRVTLRVRSLADDPALVDALAGADAEGFPHFLLQDPVWDTCFAAALAQSPELQLFLLDDDGAVVAIANSVGIAWDGDPDHLPAGTHAAMLQARGDVDSGRANTVCTVQVLTIGTSRGGGRAAAVAQAIRDLAARLGWRHVSPIRCVQKDRYPLIPLADYVGWTRPDGSVFDPWLRLQVREGGTVVGICDDSLVIEARVDDWQAWTGLEIPGPGHHVIPGGQVPLEVDERCERGRYSESHVWVVYGVDG